MNFPQFPDFPVVVRQAAIRMGPHPPNVLMVKDTWPSNLPSSPRGPMCHFLGEIVKVSPGKLLPVTNPCARDDGRRVVQYLAGCLSCRSLSLHSVVIVELQNQQMPRDPLVSRNGNIARWMPVADPTRQGRPRSRDTSPQAGPGRQGRYRSRSPQAGPSSFRSGGHHNRRRSPQSGPSRSTSPARRSLSTTRSRTLGPSPAAAEKPVNYL